MAEIHNLSEAILLNKIRPDEKRSLVGLFEVLAVLDRPYLEPKLQWVAASGQGQFMVVDLGSEEMAGVQKLLEDKKIAPETYPKFYDTITARRVFAL